MLLNISLQVPEEAEIGSEFDVVLKMTNPLKEKLTGANFHIEAPGIVRSHTVKHK